MNRRGTTSSFKLDSQPQPQCFDLGLQHSIVLDVPLFVCIFRVTPLIYNILDAPENVGDEEYFVKACHRHRDGLLCIATSNNLTDMSFKRSVSVIGPPLLYEEHVTKLSLPSDI